MADNLPDLSLTEKFELEKYKRIVGDADDIEKLKEATNRLLEHNFQQKAVIKWLVGQVMATTGEFLLVIPEGDDTLM